MGSSRLEGKVAVVTGGGNGIGRACCQRFAEEGASVVVADLLAESGAAAADSISADGGTAMFVELDVTDEAANDKLISTAVERYGGIDVLVTAAGISHHDYRSDDQTTDHETIERYLTGAVDPAAAFVGFELDAWQTVLDVNLTGTFLGVRAAARHMVDSGRGGSIITIASVAAKRPDAGPLPYTVSKAGVWMFTKAAARALGSNGIRVNSIGPGFIETNMTRVLREAPGVMEMFLENLPLGRMGQPEDIANAALFLASDESSYFTGEILHPDGGYFTE